MSKTQGSHALSLTIKDAAGTRTTYPKSAGEYHRWLGELYDSAAPGAVIELRDRFGNVLKRAEKTALRTWSEFSPEVGMLDTVLAHVDVPVPETVKFLNSWNPAYRRAKFAALAEAWCLDDAEGQAV